jgi:hypothetical protein
VFGSNIYYSSYTNLDVISKVVTNCLVSFLLGGQKKEHRPLRDTGVNSRAIFFSPPPPHREGTAKRPGESRNKNENGRVGRGVGGRGGDLSLQLF